jgi:hypothetical protein
MVRAATAIESFMVESVVIIPVYIAWKEMSSSCADDEKEERRGVKSYFNFVLDRLPAGMEFSDVDNTS